MKNLIALTLLALLALLAVQLLSHRHSLEAEVSALSQEAVRLAARPSAPKTALPLVSAVEQALKTQRLEKHLARFEPHEQAVRLSFNEVAVARLVPFLAELEQQGFSLQELSMVETAQPGFASAQLEVAR